MVRRQVIFVGGLAVACLGWVSLIVKYDPLELEPDDHVLEQHGGPAACDDGDEGTGGEANTSIAAKNRTCANTAATTAAAAAAAPEVRARRASDVSLTVFAATMLGLLIFCPVALCYHLIKGDGKLTAFFVMWGFLPEAYVAVSPKAVIRLIEQKTEPTPVLRVLHHVTDELAEELGRTLATYASTVELECLEMVMNRKMTATGLQSLCQHLQLLGTLEELSLTGCDGFGDRGLECLSRSLLKPATKGCCALLTLSLEGCNLSWAGVEVLCKALPTSRLKSLNLSANFLGREVVDRDAGDGDAARGGEGEAVAAATATATARPGTGTSSAAAASTEGKKSAATDFAFPELAEAVGTSLLETLKLNGVGLTDEDIEDFCRDGDLEVSSLKTLEFGWNEAFTDQGLDVLCKVLPSTRIEELGLEACSLTTSGLTYLSRAWMERPFPRLKLRGNVGLTDDMIRDFSKHLRQQSVFRKK